MKSFLFGISQQIMVMESCVYNRPEHNRVAEVLNRLNGKLLHSLGCYFDFCTESLSLDERAVTILEGLLNSGDPVKSLKTGGWEISAEKLPDREV